MAGPPPERVTADRMARLWDGLERSAPEEERELVREVRHRVPFAEIVPEFGSLKVSPHGIVWVGGTWTRSTRCSRSRCRLWNGS